MSREIASCHIEHYPDLMTCFQGGTNRREREEYRRFLYRAIKTQLTHRQTQVMLLYYFEGKNITLAALIHAKKGRFSICGCGKSARVDMRLIFRS